MRVEFQSGACKLAGLLDFAETPKAFAVIASCFTCSKNSKTAAYLARSLADRGISCLRIDFKGLGESEGDFAPNTLSSNIEDLRSAAQFLERDHQAPKLLVGHSFGGTAVVRAAKHIPSCRGVVTVNSPADPKRITTYFPDRLAEIREKGSATVDIAGRPFPIGRDFLEDLDRDEGLVEFSRLQKPFLICHSPNDEVVPIEQAAKAFQAAQHPKSFLSLDTADHFLSQSHDTDYLAGMIAAWSSRYL